MEEEKIGKFLESKAKVAYKTCKDNWFSSYGTYDGFDDMWNARPIPPVELKPYPEMPSDKWDKKSPVEPEERCTPEKPCKGCPDCMGIVNAFGDEPSDRDKEIEELAKFLDLGLGIKDSNNIARHLNTAGYSLRPKPELVAISEKELQEEIDDCINRWGQHSQFNEYMKICIMQKFTLPRSVPSVEIQEIAKNMKEWAKIPGLNLTPSSARLVNTWADAILLRSRDRSGVTEDEIITVIFKTLDVKTDIPTHWQVNTEQVAKAIKTLLKSKGIA